MREAYICFIKMGALFRNEDVPGAFLPPKILPKSESAHDQFHLQEQLPGRDINLEVFHRISEIFHSSVRKSKDGDYQVSSSTALVNKALKNRSSELVRVADIGIEEHVYYRELVTRKMMVYEALRIVFNDKGLGFGRRMSADIKAASMMKDRGGWLNRDKRIVGSIPGVCIGDVFFYRLELCVIGLHGQAGINYVPSSESSNGDLVATSIIVSGCCEDDEDAGDVLIYTGHGGQSGNSGRHVVHQKLRGGNLALERSKFNDIEVRVIRGIKCDNAPMGKVYVYDGLYKIVDSWFEIGKSGFGVFKFKFVRICNQPEMGSLNFKFAAELRAQPLLVRPLGYLSLDISNGKENLPVSVFNDIDSDRDPLMYEYLVKPIFPPLSYPQTNSSRGCDCIVGCCGGCLCATTNGGEFPYDSNGILVRGKPLVFECGSSCGCPPTCRNRVSQSGLKYRLEIFRSRETGWGVRTLDLIPAGSFICEYTGVVLTMQQATFFGRNGDSLVYPSRFPERWVEWGDISEVYPDFEQPTNLHVPSLNFVMDVSSMKNVACYFSHSSTPNALVQFVTDAHANTSYPHVMLFAMENIPPLRELSLDYGVVEGADEFTKELGIWK